MRKKKMELSLNIKSVELKNIKNVEKGKVDFFKGEQRLPEENIIAMYGQNGTGKTAFVNALDFLKFIMTDELSFKDNPEKKNGFYDCLTVSEDKSEISATFIYNYNKQVFTINYQINLERDDIAKRYVINKEKLEYSSATNNGYIQYNSRFKYGSSLLEDEMQTLNNDFIVSSKICKQQSSSYLFNSELIKEIGRKSKDKYLGKFLESLQEFARMNMFIITNKQYGMINLQWSLPFMFRFHKLTKKDNFIVEQITSGNQSFNLNKPQKITSDFYEILSSSIDNINDVMNRIIPDTKIAIEKAMTVLDDGSNGYDVELVTVRNNKRIPMRNESTGILKIISIIQTLIAYCSFDNIFVAIDEMDAGIFEYLFGRLLGVLKTLGKGQLFFSSHNLRPLEVLDYKNIYFSTANPQKRYTKLTNVKTNNNLRIFYLRALDLGGQKEELYTEDDISGLKIVLKRIAYEESNPS